MAYVSDAHTSSRKSVLWAACATHAIQDGLSATIYVLLPVLAQTFGLNYGQVGLFKGVKNLTQGMLEISSGFATERFGARRLLALGLAGAGLGYLMLSFAGTAIAVLACLLLVGVGVAFQHAPSSALVSRAYARSGRRGALGLYNSSGDAGKLVFTGCFSLAIGAGLTWSTMTLVFGLSAVAAAGVVYCVLGRVGLGGEAVVSGGSGPASPGSAKGWGILNRQGFSALLAVVFFDSAVQAGALTFIAFVMLAKGLPLSVATLAAVILLIGGMCGKAACGFLAERIGVRTAFSIAQLLTAVGITAIAVAPSILAYVLLPFVGVVLQGSTTITYGLVDDMVHPDRTPRGYALVYAASSFASVAGPLGFGLIADVFEIGIAMIAMALVAGLAIVPVLWLEAAEPSKP